MAYLDPSRGTDDASSKHSEWLDRFREGMRRPIRVRVRVRVR